VTPAKPDTGSKQKFIGMTDLTEAQLTDSYFKQLRHQTLLQIPSQDLFVHRNALVPEHEELDDMALGYWAQMM